MKKAKKILTLVCCAVLLVCISVGATIAYLTSNTDAVKNTFTTGNVQITLDEADVTEYGNPIKTTKDNEGKDVVTEVPLPQADRDTANRYKLVPNHTYTQDPTVHVIAKSEPCYVFVKVVNGISAIEDVKTIATQMSENGWVALTGVENVFYYNGIVDARTAQVDLLVFGQFKTKTDADVSAYTEAEITIDAYAVQADGFADAADAWQKASTTWGN